MWPARGHDRVRRLRPPPPPPRDRRPRDPAARAARGPRRRRGRPSARRAGRPRRRPSPRAPRRAPAAARRAERRVAREHGAGASSTAAARTSIDSEPSHASAAAGESGRRGHGVAGGSRRHRPRQWRRDVHPDRLAGHRRRVPHDAASPCCSRATRATRRCSWPSGLRGDQPPLAAGSAARRPARRRAWLGEPSERRDRVDRIRDRVDAAWRRPSARILSYSACGAPAIGPCRGAGGRRGVRGELRTPGVRKTGPRRTGRRDGRRAARRAVGPERRARVPRTPALPPFPRRLPDVRRHRERAEQGAADAATGPLPRRARGEPLEQRPGRAAAVADGVLLGRRQLGHRAAVGDVVGQEGGVVAEAAVAARLGRERRRCSAPRTTRSSPSPDRRRR